MVGKRSLERSCRLLIDYALQLGLSTLAQSMFKTHYEVLFLNNVIDIKLLHWRVSLITKILNKTLHIYDHGEYLSMLQ